MRVIENLNVGVLAVDSLNQVERMSATEAGAEAETATLDLNQVCDQARQRQPGCALEESSPHLALHHPIPQRPQPFRIDPVHFVLPLGRPFDAKHFTNRANLLDSSAP